MKDSRNYYSSLIPRIYQGVRIKKAVKCPVWKRFTAYGDTRCPACHASLAALYTPEAEAKERRSSRLSMAAFIAVLIIAAAASVWICVNRPEWVNYFD